jgi:hypothetical protein
VQQSASGSFTISGRIGVAAGISSGICPENGQLCFFYGTLEPFRDFVVQRAEGSGNILRVSAHELRDSCNYSPQA